MNQTFRFGDKLQELIDLLEKMTGQLMMNQMDDYKDTIPELSKLMEMCFPKIIISYSDPLLKDVSEDAVYWSDQLGRIIDTLKLDDKFARMDVLYQETRANLIAYNNMIKETEIAEWTVEEPEDMPETENS